MTPDEMKARILELEGLVRAKSTKGGIKVSEKGAVSVYGIGRFPVTLYGSQWESLLARAEEIRKFIADNSSLLKVKPAKAEAQPSA